MKKLWDPFENGEEYDSAQKGDVEHLYSRRNVMRFKKWNRKFHIYLGLYLLFFIWLFSVSGLLLNNPEWSISNFWPDREVTSYQQGFIRPDASGDIAIANDLMRQLDIRGEIHQTRWNLEDEVFGVQIRRPGQMLNMNADFISEIVDVEEIRVNTWGLIRMLHTFTGARGETGENRNWLLTQIWSFSMDAVAAGMIILVLSGFYMWYRLKQKFLPGLVALGLGTACCWFFLFGLAMLF